MNILFRADSSSNIGTGHIMRDLVLAERDFSSDKVIFCVQDLEGNINQKIEEAGYEIEILNSNNIDELISIIQKLNINMLVIDHYDIGYHDEKKLKTVNSKLTILSFDDMYEKHYCDILLNHNIYADKNRYEKLVPVWCDIRCGSKYSLIRKDFINTKNNILKINNLLFFRNCSRKFIIFLAMGGADTENLNIKTLEALKGFSSIKVNLFTTKANKHINILKTYVQDKPWIELHINCNNIACIMKESNLGVVTPSLIASEAVFMGLPFVAIKTADNQEEMCRYLKKSGYSVLEKFQEKKFKNILNREIVRLINFINLKDREKKMVLSWRNNYAIKKWMYSKHDITLDEHFSFIDKLKVENNKIYFLVKQNMKYIGVIDFINIDFSKKECEFGIYANPFEKIIGVGRVLEEACIKHAFDVLRLKKLKLEVLVDNVQVINLHKKYNFKETARKLKYNNHIICMELNIENRKV